MAVIALDFDGTLIDCRVRQTEVACAICRALDFPLSRGAFWNAKRDGSTTRQALLEQNIDQASAAIVAKLWLNWVEFDSWLRLDRELENASRAVKLLSRQGNAFHIITARRDSRALFRQLSWLGWSDLFASVYVVSPGDAARQKAERLSQVGASLFVGDSETDLEAAEAAGIPFKALYSGQRSKQFWDSRLSFHRTPGYATVADALEDWTYAR